MQTHNLLYLITAIIRQKAFSLSLKTEVKRLFVDALLYWNLGQLRGPVTRHIFA